MLVLLNASSSSGSSLRVGSPCGVGLGRGGVLAGEVGTGVKVGLAVAYNAAMAGQAARPPDQRASLPHRFGRQEYLD